MIASASWRIREKDNAKSRDQAAGADVKIFLYFPGLARLARKSTR
jgi:hypothetical protein